MSLDKSVAYDFYNSVDLLQRAAAALGHARETFPCMLVTSRSHVPDAEPLNTSSAPLLSVFFHLTSFIRASSSTSIVVHNPSNTGFRKSVLAISYCLVIPNEHHSFKQANIKPITV